MNEQQAAVEAFAAVSNILDVLDADIAAFAILRTQWRSPRVPVHVFERALTSFRDAVFRIKRWITLGPFDTLSLYSRQLKLCLSCARLLATRIHVEIGHFRTVPDRELVAARHSNQGFNRTGFCEIQNALETQRTALLHVLSEMSGCEEEAEGMSESEDLKSGFGIEAPEVSWQVLRLELDRFRSSMAVHEDVDLIQAYYSGCKINSATSTLVFNLDKAPCSLQQVRPRRASLVESVRKLFSRSPSEATVLGSRAAKRRSWEIDQFLALQSQGRWGQLRILRTGMTTSVNFASLIRTRYLPVSQRRSYRRAVIQNLVEDYASLASASAESGSKPYRTDTQEYLEYLSNFKLDDEISTLVLDEIAEAIIGLHQDRHIQDLIITPTYFWNRTAQLSLQNAGRILSPDFIPTDFDIARLPPAATGLREEAMHLGRLDLAVIELGGCRSERRKFIHALEEMQAIFFTAELNVYDNPLLHGQEDRANIMGEQLVLFDSIVNTRYFPNCPVVLLLDGANAFRRKLTVSPVKRSFPEYEGDGSFEDAAQFFVCKFLELNRAHRVIFTYVYDSSDTQSVDRVLDSLEETLEMVGLKDKRGPAAWPPR